MAAKKAKKTATKASKAKAQPKAKAKTTAKASKAKKTTKKAAPKATARKTAAKKKTTAKATKATKATTKAAKKGTVKATSKATTKAVKAPVAKRTIGPARINFDNVKKTRSKGQIVGAIAESTGLTKKEVSTILDSLSALAGYDLSSNAGQFTLPGLIKMIVRKKPATKARKGVNPFTGEAMTFKAKPASNVVRARPLKALKDRL